VSDPEFEAAGLLVGLTGATTSPTRPSPPD
jgi:hypothetical protein